MSSKKSERRKICLNSLQCQQKPQNLGEIGEKCFSLRIQLYSTEYTKVLSCINFPVLSHGFAVQLGRILYTTLKFISRVRNTFNIVVWFGEKCTVYSWLVKG